MRMYHQQCRTNAKNNQRALRYCKHILLLSTLYHRLKLVDDQPHRDLRQHVPLDNPLLQQLRGGKSFDQNFSRAFDVIGGWESEFRSKWFFDRYNGNGKRSFH